MQKNSFLKKVFIAAMIVAIIIFIFSSYQKQSLKDDENKEGFSKKDARIYTRILFFVIIAIFLIGVFYSFYF